MYEELWKLSAGPLVDVPQAEERVYYFPQGHMEQVKHLSIFVIDMDFYFYFWWMFIFIFLFV